MAGLPVLLHRAARPFVCAARGAGELVQKWTNSVLAARVEQELVQ